MGLVAPTFCFLFSGFISRGSSRQRLEITGRAWLTHLAELTECNQGVEGHFNHVYYSDFTPSGQTKCSLSSNEVRRLQTQVRTGHGYGLTLKLGDKETTGDEIGWDDSKVSRFCCPLAESAERTFACNKESIECRKPGCSEIDFLRLQNEQSVDKVCSILPHLQTP